MCDFYSDSTTRFCESIDRDYQVWRFEEFANSVSSIAMIVYGIIGMRSVNHLFTSDLHSLLILNGIGSFLFHATMHRGWQFLDEFTMTVLIVTGVKYIYLELYSKKFITIIANCVLMVLLIIDVTDNKAWDLTFGLVFIPILVSFVIIYRRCSGDVRKQDFHKMVGVAIVTGTIASVVWLIDRYQCTYNTNYFVLHAFWHILMGYSVYYVICIVDLLYSLEHSTFGIEYQWYIFPRVTNRIPDDFYVQSF